MARGKGKGSGFEREICKILSLWWTKGKREDVFWRSTTSGARATVRNRAGKQTFGQYGDVQATDPIGQPLLNVCNIEVKRGYSRETIGNILDAPARAAEQTYEKFMNQAKADHKKAGSMFWMLIAKRDRKEAVVYIPMKFYRKLADEWNSVTPLTDIKLSIKLKYKKKKIFSCPLSEFLRVVRPKLIRRIARK